MERITDIQTMPYMVESKREGILPRCLTRWKSVTKCGLDDLKEYYLKDTPNFHLLNVHQTPKSTILEYRAYPHWSSEQWDKFRAMEQAQLFPITDPSEVVLYRITPPIKVEFGEH
ncbi:MAG TPA: hypothetical protein P5277_04465 [Candidatus Paceibacterota bacterium]|nr:hypothetical protein [Candidatus Paceibacterota bacterium]